MTLSMFHICKKRLLLYYITYTKVKRFKVKKKKVEKIGEERRRKRGEKGKAREEKKENKNAHTCMLLPQSTTFPFVA